MLAAWAVVSKSVSALYVNESAGIIAPCSSPLYCQGEILKAIQLAQPYSDAKTFVDLPTLKPLDQVIAAFNNLSRPITNNSALQSFLSINFGEAGSEIAPVDPSQLTTNATLLLNGVSSSIYKAFVQQVIGIWPTLTRQYTGSTNCTGCVSSFLPINGTFVVSGGRFREVYISDCYFILQGLLRSGGNYIEIGRNLIEIFLGFVDQFGFAPNGSRMYYLNRSQPPVLGLMVQAYVRFTNDTSILARAIPLLEKEMQFWATNNSVNVTSPSSNVTYMLNRYFVQKSTSARIVY